MLNELDKLFSVSNSKHDYDIRVKSLTDEIQRIEHEMHMFCSRYNEWLITEKISWRLIDLKPNNCTQVLWNISVNLSGELQRFRVSKPIIDALVKSRKANEIQISLMGLNQNALKNIEIIEQRRIALNHKAQLLIKITNTVECQVKYRKISLGGTSALH